MRRATERTMSSSSTRRTVPSPFHWTTGLVSRGAAAWRRLARRRKEDPETRARALRARHLDRAVVAAHDAEHRRQAEPAARELRAEERIEDLLARLLVHSAARVGHLEEDVRPGPQRVLEAALAQEALARVACARRQRDLPASPSERLGSVRDEVHHDLAELRRVALDRREVGARGSYRRTAFLEIAVWSRLPISSTRWLRFSVSITKRPLPAYASSWFVRSAARLRRRLDLLQVLAAAEASSRFGEPEARVAEDRHEEVVEVVRDAAGEHAEALHLLRVAHLRLERALVRRGALAPGALGEHAGRAFEEVAFVVGERSAARIARRRGSRSARPRRGSRRSASLRTWTPRRSPPRRRSRTSRPPRLFPTSLSAAARKVSPSGCLSASWASDERACCCSRRRRRSVVSRSETSLAGVPSHSVATERSSTVRPGRKVALDEEPRLGVDVELQPRERLGRRAEELRRGRVREPDRVVDVEQHDAVGAGFDHAPEHRLALAQRGGLLHQVHLELMALDRVVDRAADGLGLDLALHEVVLGTLVHGVEREVAVVEARHDDRRAPSGPRPRGAGASRDRVNPAGAGRGGSPRTRRAPRPRAPR